MPDNDLREALAAGSHDIWANWQRWQHSVCTPNADGSLTIPAAMVVSLYRSPTE
jgi:hypothetical protein